MNAVAAQNMTRNEVIKAIKDGLKRRSTKSWSVTGGRGTAYGWIKIDAPPARQTWRHRLKADVLTNRPEDYEGYDSGQPGGSSTPDDLAELGKLLGLESVHCQGVSIPASSQYYQEYMDRANGRSPSVIGEPYWD